jgi:long-chain acyl-CoA synthetase
VGQAFVYGDSFQSALVAILIPDEDPVKNMLMTSGETALAKAPFAEICRSDTLKKIIMEDIKRAAKANGIHGFEIPKIVHLDSELFSVENELLTPTFKLKRQQAQEKYQKEIDAMYAALPKPKSKL